MNFFKILILSVLVFSCAKKNENIESVSCEKNQPPESNLIWQVPLAVVGEDTISSRSMTPILHDNKVLHSSLGYSATGSETFFYRNAETGEKIWEWNDASFGSTPHSRGAFKFEDNLVLSSRGSVYVIDVNDGQKKWDSPYTFANVRISGVDDDVYFVTVDKALNADTTTLIKSSIESQNWTSVFSINKQDNDGYSPEIEPPLGWKNSQGETILIFQSRYYNFSIGKGKVDLFAYNLDQDSLVWSDIDIEETGNASIQSPIIKDDRLYFQGQSTLFCYDLNDGEVVWKRTFSTGFGSSNSAIAEGKIIINAYSKNIYALDLATGDIIWENSETETENSTSMVYHNGNVYFISEGRGKLLGIQVSDGEVVLEMDSPNDTGFNGVGLRSGIAIHPELNYLYMSDNYFLMCIKLPE